MSNDSCIFFELRTLLTNDHCKIYIHVKLKIVSLVLLIIVCYRPYTLHEVSFIEQVNTQHRYVSRDVCQHIMPIKLHVVRNIWQVELNIHDSKGGS